MGGAHGNSGWVGITFVLKKKNEILGRWGSNVKFPLWWGYGYFLDLLYTLFDLEYLPFCLHFLALRDHFVHSRHNYTIDFL